MNGAEKDQPQLKIEFQPGSEQAAGNRLDEKKKIGQEQEAKLEKYETLSLSSVNNVGDSVQVYGCVGSPLPQRFFCLGVNVDTRSTDLYSQ